MDQAPGRAQTAPADRSGRFAFADTTLLRDTLNLEFSGLFPLADSLGLPPDTLRALAIRYRMSLNRMVFLADSLIAPIDSVGVIMRREQFNPLANRNVERLNDLRYTSSYGVARTSSSWTNGAEWNYIQGPAYLRNSTNISMDRYKAAGDVNLRQTRAALTEAGWRLRPTLSLGGRANLERFDSRYPGSLSNEAETKNEFQLSARSKQKPSRNWQTDFSFFTGVLDLTNSTQVKRGFSGTCWRTSATSTAPW